MKKSIAIPLSKPSIDNLERAFVNECLNSGWISSIGSFIERFESSVAELHSTRYALSTCNGTVALHLALLSMELKPGDEVIVPNITFIATANAIKYCGATPVFVDVEPGTLNLDPKLIKEKITTTTKGIIVVHLYGMPCDMNEVLAIAKTYNIWVLEDSAQAHGASYQKVPIGGIGDIGTLSFYGNKLLTTGEGGMILTNNENLYKKALLLRGQGMDPNKKYWFSKIGFNYRMTNIAAAIGLAQVARFREFQDKRRTIFNWYEEKLERVQDYVSIPETSRSDRESANWLYTIYLKNLELGARDEMQISLAKLGIETRPVFYPLNHLPPYKTNEEFPVSSEWSYSGISLPTFHEISEREVSYICEAVVNFILRNS